VLEEGEAQVATLDSPEAVTQAIDHVEGVLRLEVREFLSLDVAPEGFHRVEVGCVFR
jgi:hypothetical protein